MDWTNLDYKFSGEQLSRLTIVLMLDMTAKIQLLVEEVAILKAEKESKDLEEVDKDFERRVNDIKGQTLAQLYDKRLLSPE